MRTLLLFLIIVNPVFSFGQSRQDYLVRHVDTTYNNKYLYVFTNINGDTILKLDSAKYIVCFNDTMQYFIVVGIRHKKGWWAIDRNENTLFQVYNTSIGEPSPDEMHEGLIRIVDDSDKIGFADYKGEITIKPQFEAVSYFYKDYAVIGKQCKPFLWCCEGENEDKHYVNLCTQNGYINRNGKIQELRNVPAEQVFKKLNWPANQ